MASDRDDAKLPSFAIESKFPLDKTSRSNSLSSLTGSKSTNNQEKTQSRKRKTTDDDFTAVFESFSKAISDQLKGFKIEIDSCVSSINTNINTVLKADLEKLTVVTNNIKSDLISMRAEYRQLRGDLTEVQTKQNVISSEVSSLQTSLTFHTNQHDELSKQVKILSSDMSELSSTKAEVLMLKMELNTMQQKERQSNIEIAGLTESKSENLLAIFGKIAIYLGVSLNPDDVVHIHRVQPMNKSPGRPKTVIVKFSSSFLRDSFISASRRNKGMTTANIGLPGEAKALFINEHLTPFNKMLHKKAREAANLKNYQFVWIKNGKVFCRKEDKAPLIRIREESDLKQIV